jgi:hypothetical protein
MKNKYNVSLKSERTIDGVIFDSKAEASRYAELKLLEKAGEITRLILQPSFVIQQKCIKWDTGEKIREITYIADFEYYNKEGKRIVEDVKGVKTDAYKLKKRMFIKNVANVYDIVFIEYGT